MSDTPRTAFADPRPLFIVGSVRSGTTFTRDLLRRVPNFICPEETHFYRWTEAYRTPASKAAYQGKKILQQHRTIDGVAEADYLKAVRESTSKADLQRRYITLFAEAKGIKGPYRWFDKTPQNIYGAPLMAQDFPRSRFLHLVRNPLNVVASLIAGRQMHITDIHGACNYWLEAVTLATSLRRAYPKRVLEIRYEDLVVDVPGTLEIVLRHARVEHPEGLYSAKDGRPERNLWKKDLTADQISIVVQRCGPLAASKGYDLKADVAMSA